MVFVFFCGFFLFVFFAFSTVKWHQEFLYDRIYTHNFAFNLCGSKACSYSSTAVPRERAQHMLLLPVLC